MASPPSKRPPRSRKAEPPPAQRRKAALPFDDEQVASSAQVRASRLKAARKRLDEEPPPRTDETDRRDAEDRRSTDPAETKESQFTQAFLFVEKGPGSGTSVGIGQGLLFIGRASTSGLRIQHPSVSRRHAQLTRNGDRFFIRDLASQNGTYVNQLRIDKEVEIFPGDELVMGTAQLRLRGPKGSEAGNPRTRPLQPGGKRSRSTSPTTVALAAGLVGFALAAIVMFVWFKMGRGPSFEDMGDQRPTDKPANAQGNTPAGSRTKAPEPEEQPAPRSPAPEPEAKPAPHTEATPAPEEKPASQAQAPTPEEKPAPEPKPELAAAPKPAEGESEAKPLAAVEDPRPPKGEKKPAIKIAAVNLTRAPRKTPAEDPAPAGPVRGDPTILARFEAGKLQDAIDLARKKGAKDLLAKLTRFQTAYEAGEQALAKNDEANALKNLEAAFKAAQALSEGWGKYSTELRHQLSGLHMRAGTRLAGRDPAAARKELNTAIQYDPENGKAKDLLTRLDPSYAPPKADTKAPDKKAAIDEAFGN